MSTVLHIVWIHEMKLEMKLWSFISSFIRVSSEFHLADFVCCFVFCVLFFNFVYICLCFPDLFVWIPASYTMAVVELRQHSTREHDYPGRTPWLKSQPQRSPLLQLDQDRLIPRLRIQCFCCCYIVLYSAICSGGLLYCYLYLFGIMIT